VSEIETTAATTAELAAVVAEMRADRAVGQSLLDAARARADQDQAALRDVSADRDAWQSAAKNLQTELWRQMDILRAEQVQHSTEIEHLSAAMNALLEIAQSRVDAPATGPVVPDIAGPVRETLAELPPMPDIAMPVIAPPVAALPAVAFTPITIADDPLPEAPVIAQGPESVAEAAPVPPVVVVPVEMAPTPTATVPRDPIRMQAYVPADDSKDVAHLAVQNTETADELPAVPMHDRDRVGFISELAAVAGDSSPSEGTTAAPATVEEPALTGHVDILPTPEPAPAPKKRQLRLPRLTG
jgi:hypothetical protein